MCDPEGAVGLYVLSFLQPGCCEITAASAGFKTYTCAVVETSQVMELNTPMELGAVTESIPITGAAPLLTTSDSTVGQFIGQRTVRDMPPANRLAPELVRLSSNVVFVNYSGDAKAQFAVAGGRSCKSAYLLDGGNVQNIRMASLRVDIDPPVEVIREFRVVQNGYAAEYGGSAGGVAQGQKYVQFRGDFFNAFNDPDFGRPASPGGRPAAGSRRGTCGFAPPSSRGAAWRR